MAGFTAADAARWIGQAIGRPVDVISQAVEAAPLAPAASTAECPNTLMRLVNLARIVRDGPTVADVASLAWSDLHHVVPGTGCGCITKLTLTWPRSTGLRVAG